MRYDNRAQADRRLVTYTSPILTDDLEITGHPAVTLHLRSTHSDGAVCVYLEDVDPDGTVRYVTEGQLRALHRRISSDRPPLEVFVPHHSFRREDAMPLVPGEVTELRIGLLPVSVLIRAGHRLRIAIAGHDKDTVARIPVEGVPTLTLERTAAHSSHIDLPVIERWATTYERSVNRGSAARPSHAAVLGRPVIGDQHDRPGSVIPSTP